MVNAQDWLNKNYPIDGVCQRKDEKGNNHEEFGKKRGEIEKISIKDEKLEGKLRIVGFANLEELICYKNPKLIGLKIENCPKLRKFTCSWNKLTELNLNLPELEEFACAYNQLINLDISKCRSLRKVNCSNNNLTAINLSNLNFEKLIKLDLGNNNFSKQDLTRFSKFINLKNLKIGTHSPSRFSQNIYNRFCGRLPLFAPSLRNLTKKTNVMKILKKWK